MLVEWLHIGGLSVFMFALHLLQPLYGIGACVCVCWCVCVLCVLLPSLGSAISWLCLAFAQVWPSFVCSFSFVLCTGVDCYVMLTCFEQKKREKLCCVPFCMRLGSSAKHLVVPSWRS